MKKPKHKWLILVIYPTRKLERPASIAFEPFMKLPQLHRIYLEDYKNRTGLSSSLDLLSLIACSQGQTMARARKLIENQDEISAEMLDFIETILVYKLPKLSREEIKKMLGLDDVKLKDTRFYQEVGSEGREEEGKKFLKRLLINRFGELPKDIQKKLEQANLEQIEQWGDRLFDAPSLEAVFKTTIH